MSSRFEGKVAVVTGASRGIGHAIAVAFAAEGAKVVLTSRKQEALDAVAADINRRHPGAATALACHMGDPAKVAELVETTCDRVGIPDILVNNAGTNPYFGPMVDAPDWAWDKTFNVNARGSFVAACEVGRRLRSADRPGAIINITSVLGMGAARLQGIYGMTKAAIISMTQTLAFELGASGIRVNAVAPGLVDTKFAAVLTGTPELTKHFTGRTAFGEVCGPEAITGAVLWLASEESSYVTGQTIAVDGGFSVS
jgi:NAD(P)-dependent dehydrogenase (short-subunit alcohol dehydrogenase family)